MDEETLIKQFEEWNKEQDIWYWLMDSADAAKAAAQAAWIASARQTNKRTREECAEICESDSMFKSICPFCAEAIRATILEE